MSKTAFVDYGGAGFWAFDVGLGIFLKFLIDRANLLISETKDKHRKAGDVESKYADWLSACIDMWRQAAVLGANVGLSYDYPMTEKQVQIVLRLIDEVCHELGARESIPRQEMESWDVLSGHGVFSRGYTEYPTAPVIELGRAIQDLLRGTLLPAPKGKLWFFGTPTGRETVAMRYEDPERPEGISIKICSDLAVEQSFLVANETDMTAGQVHPILKFLTNAAPQPGGTGQIQLSPTQAEAIFAIVQETRVGLSPLDDNSVALAGERTTVAIKQGRFRLELEYLSDAPKEWKQVEQLVKLVRQLASGAAGNELD